MYEYIITLGEESQFIWSNVHAGHAALFMINRLNMVCMFVVMVSGTISIDHIVVCCQCIGCVTHIHGPVDLLGVLLLSLLDGLRQ